MEVNNIQILDDGRIIEEGFDSIDSAINRMNELLDLEFDFVGILKVVTVHYILD